ncbi:MAG: putative nucleotidyltransferase [Saprospiraceae bacterium]|jgi:predicted nucleotidyltransferase
MISYNALQVDGLKDVLETIAIACNTLGIDFFVVGAVARNIWYANSKKELRGTKDIDFGVYVPDKETYEQLKAYLIKQYQYTQDKENAFCLITPDGKGIDLMPFGKIANDGEVMIEGSGMTTLKLDGFEEA